MPKLVPLILVFLLAFTLSSCSKKTTPTSSGTITNPVEKNEPVLTDAKPDTAVAVKNDSIVLAKKPAKPKPKPSIPKVIVVNDKAASKSVDGRYYYDLQGHRYWRNNKDGKYYLYHKSMNTDEAFKKPD